MDTVWWVDTANDPSLNYRINLAHYKNADVKWLKSFKSFVEYLTRYKLPEKIYFGTINGDKTEKDCIQYLIHLCTNLKLKLPQWHCFGNDQERVDENATLLKHVAKNE